MLIGGSGTGAAAAEQQELAVALFDVKVDPLFVQRRHRRADALCESGAVDVRGDALGEPVSHLFEDQVRQLRAAALRRLCRLQRDDLFDHSIGDANVVLGKEVLAGLAQREDVVRPACLPAHLRDIDVAVAGEDVEVAADGGGREAEFFGQLIDRRPAATAQDAEDRLAGGFHWVGRPLIDACPV